VLHFAHISFWRTSLLQRIIAGVAMCFFCAYTLGVSLVWFIFLFEQEDIVANYCQTEIAEQSMNQAAKDGRAYVNAVLDRTLGTLGTFSSNELGHHSSVRASTSAHASIHAATTAWNLDHLQHIQQLRPLAQPPQDAQDLAWRALWHEAASAMRFFWCQRSPLRGYASSVFQPPDGSGDSDSDSGSDSDNV
jgi:hypothetical protein